jgi:anti-anti-sigma factor
VSFVQVRTIDGVPVASLPGDVDSANAAEVLQELTREVSNEPAGLVVDLTETRYLDSAGIEVLFRLRDKLANRRQRLAVVVPGGSHLRRLLELTGLDKAVTLTDEIPAAVSAVTEGGKQSAPVDP